MSHPLDLHVSNVCYLGIKKNWVFIVPSGVCVSSPCASRAVELLIYLHADVRTSSKAQASR